jgi:thymidylate synthase
MEVFSEYLDFNLNYLSALQYAVKNIDGEVEKISSRVGAVYDLGPCCFEFCAMDLPVTILSGRYLNPFFAIAEAAWIIDGSNKLSSLKYFINSYDKFSDDGNTLNGAYGYRARKYFGMDQINEIVSLLKREPSTRRAVLTLYSPDDLSNNSSRDIPCNTSVFFKIRDSKLDMMVINRSNDLFLGIPYNVFVFNVLLKYIAIKVGCEVGNQRHMSDSLHLYAKDFDTVKDVVTENNIENINKHLGSFSALGNNFVNQVFNSRKAILDLDFLQITDNFLKKMFLLYAKHKNNELVMVGEVDNIIEYAIEQWFKKYNK